MDTALIPIALGAFLFAGTVKGLVGIGLPTALISVLAQFMDPRTAIALLLAPSLILNVWQIWRSGGFVANLKPVWPFAIVMFVSIWYFSRFAAGLDVDTLIAGVGAVILLFVLSSFLATPPPIPPQLDLPIQLGAGLAAGVIGGLTAIWSPPMVMYLLARRVSKETFIGTTGVLILSGSVPLFIGYWQAGLLTGQLASLSLGMIVPAMIGFGLGEWMRKWLDAEQFKKLLLLTFLVMGLNLLRRSLF